MGSKVAPRNRGFLERGGPGAVSLDLRALVSRHPAGSSFVFTLLFFTFFWLTSVPRFETNDDAVQMIFISGLFGIGSDQPAAIQSFAGSSPLPAQFLQLVYRLLGPRVNWYAVLFYGIHFASLFLLSRVMIGRKADPARLFLYLVALLFFELYFLQYLQFTTTAAMAALSGGLLLHDALGREERAPAPLVVLAVLLLGSSGLLRKEVFLLFALLFLPMGLLKLRGRPAASKLVPHLLAVALFAAGLAQHWSVLDAGGRRYYRQNGAFANTRENPRVVRPQFSGIQLAGYEPTPESLRAYGENGWSDNDVYLFSMPWIYFDEEVFSDEKIENVLSHYRLFIRYNPLPQILVWFVDFGIFSIVFLAALVGFALLADRRERKCFLAAAAAVLLVILVLGYSWRMPHRIFLPLAMFVCAAGVYGMREGLVADYRRRFPGAGGFAGLLAALVLSLALLSVPLKRYTTANAQNRSGYAAATMLLAKIAEVTRENRSLLVCGVIPPLEYLFRPANAELFRGVDVLLNGWVTRSPANDLLLKKYGLRNAVRGLFESPRTLYLGSPETAWRIVAFIKEHYQRDVVFRPVLDLSRVIPGCGHAIYRFSPVSPQPGR